MYLLKVFLKIPVILLIFYFNSNMDSNFKQSNFDGLKHMNNEMSGNKNEIFYFDIIITAKERENELLLLLDSINKDYSNFIKDFSNWRLNVYLIRDGGNPYQKLENQDFLFNFTLLNQDINRGSSFGRNLGLEYSKGKIVIFLDSDVIIDYDFLKNHVVHHLKHKDAIGIAGLTLFKGKKNFFFKEFENSYFTIPFKRPYFSKETDWAPTSNISFKREKLYGFQFCEVFPKGGGGEDIDFCLKVCKGEKILLFKDLKVFHKTYSNVSVLKRLFRWGYADGIIEQIYPNKRIWTFTQNPIFLLFYVIITLLFYIINESYFVFIVSSTLFLLYLVLYCIIWKRWLYNQKIRAGFILFLLETFFEAGRIWNKIKVGDFSGVYSMPYHGEGQKNFFLTIFLKIRIARNLLYGVLIIINVILFLS